MCSIKKEVFYKERCFQTFCEIHRKTPVPEYLFFSHTPATLLKKRLWDSCFPVNFEEFLGTLFLHNTSG